MTEKEIVQALRCTSTPGDHTNNCEQCPYWKKEQLNGRLKEKLGTDTWTSCDIDKVGLDAADLIERLTAENAALWEKVPQWISVEDRLPEVWKNEENDVLVNYMIYAPEFGADIGNYHAEAKRWLCMAIPCTVTHWMPLPEAPKFADVLRGAPEALEAHNGKENS